MKGSKGEEDVVDIEHGDVADWLLIPQLAQWSHWLLKNKATTSLKLTLRMKLLCAIRKPQ